MKIDMDEVADALFEMDFEHQEGNIFKRGRVRLQFVERGGEDACWIYLRHPYASNHTADELVYFDSIEELKDEIATFILAEIVAFEDRLLAWKGAMLNTVEVMK